MQQQRLTKIIANFSTALDSSTPLSPASTTGKVTNVLDKDGNKIPTGWYTMLIDYGKNNEQHLLFYLDSDTKVFNQISVITRQGIPLSGTGLLSHNAGAVMTLTDFSNILNLTNLFIDTSDDLYQVPAKWQFQKDIVVNTSINSSSPATVGQLNGAIAGQVTPATQTSAGTVAKTKVDDYISGIDKLTPDSQELNIEGLEGIKSVLPVVGNNILVLGIDNTLRLINLVNGSVFSNVALVTNPGQNVFSAVLKYTSNTDILLLKSDNTIVRYTGNNTFVNFAYTGTVLPSGRMLKREVNPAGNTIYAVFQGSLKVWIIDLTNPTPQVSATTDIQLTTTIETNATSAISFSTDWINKILYVCEVVNISGIIDTVKLGRYNLNTQTLQQIGDANWIIQVGAIKNVVFWKNDANNTYIILNGTTAYNNTDTTSTYLTKNVIVKLSLPTQTLALVSFTNSAVKAQKWTGTSIDNTYFDNFIINDYQYWITYPIVGTTISTTSALFFNNLLENIPAVVTPDIKQIITGNNGDLTITARKCNLYDADGNVEQVFAGGSVMETPPATTGAFRNDLIVIDRNNTLQIRQGVENSNTVGSAQSGDWVLGKVNIKSGQDSFDVGDLVNYDNRVKLVSSFETYYGGGIDGDVTISTNTTLTRDMYYNNLTINSGVTLTTGNFKIYYKTLNGSGTISSKGLGGAGGVLVTKWWCWWCWWWCWWCWWWWWCWW